MNQTLSQERSAAAWAHVNEDDVGSKYVSLVKSTPAHIQINGLGQTVAFYLAKEEPEHTQVLRHLAQWVLRSGTKADRDKTPRDLLDAITGGDSDDYRTLTRGAIAYLEWLKRLAEAAANETEGTNGK